MLHAKPPPPPSSSSTRDDSARRSSALLSIPSAMKTRKNFSFDIPRLKLGPSKADNRAFPTQLNVDPESPPVTPKSVRPPLSPIVEAELRASCAYVLQNFRPSHVVYNEHTAPAAPQKAQLDYATIKESVPKDMQRPTHRPISKISARSNEKPSSEPEAGESEAMSPVGLRPRSHVPADDALKLDKLRRADSQSRARSRAEQLMGGAPSKAPPPTTRQRSDSHVHTLSSQAKAEPTERPRTAARTESTETTGSTPQTDTTDYPWSDEKSSTGMTSAAVTPARGSKRTSSQALQGGSESGSVPKPEPMTDDWMRQELDKFKKAQDERQQHQQQQHQEKTVPGSKTYGDETDTTPKILTQVPTPSIVKVPPRKPIGVSRSASRRAMESPRSESQQSGVLNGEMIRSPSVRAREGSSYPSRAGSRQAQTSSRAPSRARSITRQVREYIKPTRNQQSQRPEEVSRPPSRSGGVTNQVREYFKPGSTAGSRKGSMDSRRPEVRPGSRSRSIDSFRSTMSDMVAGASAEANKVKTWKPFHRRGRSHTAGEEDAAANGESRGRTATRNGKQASQSNGKPPVDLNRELPPLPGLDSWKNYETPAITSPIKSPRSHRSTRSRQEAKPLSLEPDIGERDEIVAARMGSPTPPRSQNHSHQPSLEPTYVPPQPSGPPPPAPTEGGGAPQPPPVMSATMSGPSDFEYQIYNSSGGSHQHSPLITTSNPETKPSVPPPTASTTNTTTTTTNTKPASSIPARVDSKKDHHFHLQQHHRQQQKQKQQQRHRRSQSFQADYYPADLHEKVRQAMLGPSPTTVAGEKSPTSPIHTTTTTTAAAAATSNHGSASASTSANPGARPNKLPTIKPSRSIGGGGSGSGSGSGGGGPITGLRRAVSRSGYGGNKLSSSSASKDANASGNRSGPSSVPHSPAALPGAGSAGVGGAGGADYLSPAGATGGASSGAGKTPPFLAHSLKDRKWWQKKMGGGIVGGGRD
ncbi:hypothetical protein KC360_g9061 [Hortaea werneckii]|nr:hypothetical protein KC325_g9061 [Hortaea werneckii]KAI7139934.1 hypothetical protein KC344_g9055 [Hortaea werneckii]KAI7166705.1 hypothetical protein KC360_g9061 [Hortaea werneckii]KAI7501829.1 hypothetical protein KC347_g9126 [Hortaea werneckii]